ncbi:hypothetical protein Tco_0404970 [Tanacetum coccineum]
MARSIAYAQRLRTNSKCPVWSCEGCLFYLWESIGIWKYQRKQREETVVFVSCYVSPHEHIDPLNESGCPPQDPNKLDPFRQKLDHLLSKKRICIIKQEKVTCPQKGMRVGEAVETIGSEYGSGLSHSADSRLRIQDLFENTHTQSFR